MSLPEFSLQGSLFSIDAKTKGSGQNKRVAKTKGSEPKQKGRTKTKGDQNKRVGTRIAIMAETKTKGTKTKGSEPE